MTTATALLVSDDPDLLDDVLRLAAAAGVTLHVAHDSSAALQSWPSAHVVLVGGDQAVELARRRPVHRDAVHVVTRQPAPDELFRAALDLGARQVAELPAAETWLVELLTDVGDGSGGKTAATIAVVGGSGGSGATTFAAALACMAAESGPTLLVDADPFGGGIDRVVAFEEIGGLRWDSLTHSTGRLSSRSLREALPHRGGLAVLSWSAGDQEPLEPFAVREVLSAAQRGNDFVVVDLPRHPSSVAAEVLMRSDHVLLVCGLTVPAVAAASRVAHHLLQAARRVHLVARGRAAAAVDAQTLSSVVGVPLAATMNDQRRLAEWIDLGAGPIRSRRGPLARAARSVLAELAPSTVRAS
jgi:secretion/DNA translocation related CpaE-like protein